jgi:hypothetical protein
MHIPPTAGNFKQAGTVVKPLLIDLSDRISDSYAGDLEMAEKALLPLVKSDHIKFP